MLEAIFITCLGITFSLRLSQYILAFLSPFDSKTDINLDNWKVPEEQPFVSIHVAIRNEPPGLVIQTLRSLLNIDYDRYEIIVLDNNTTREETWKPVEEFCRSRDRTVFLHVPALKGYKAGALNRCVELMDERTEYILVADADYEVIPGALKACVRYSQKYNADLLQFPQSYRNMSPRSDLVLEYNSYYRIFMSMANRFNCVLSTGSLSFIRCGSLKKIGGWECDTVTEDTELGVRLIASGCKTLFVPREIGSGLTPLDHHSFEKQRRRWVTGNIQVLIKHFGMVLKSGLVDIKQKAGIVLQLTALVNYRIPMLILFGLMHLAGISLQTVVLFWIYFILMTVLKAMIYRTTCRGMGVRKIAGILMLNQSVSISTGLLWMKALSPYEPEFEITGKKQQ